VKLVLHAADRATFFGQPFGRALASGEVVVAELVCNTGQSGYEELLTDPSYFRQIVVMSFPLIGNTGINGSDAEHERVFLSGLIVREHEPAPAHHRTQRSLTSYLAEQHVPGLCGIDTRALVRRLRTHGTLRAALAADETPDEVVLAALQKPLPIDHVAQVSTRTSLRTAGPGPHVAVLDYGAKRGILRELRARGCAVTLFPHDTSADAVLAAAPDGVILSNGPGNPLDLPGALPIIRVLQERVPLLGICLGHQLFALANGARTEKMHYGHRGMNHAVREGESGRALITAHNHGYAVTEASLLDTELRSTYRDLNDGCIEGLRHTRLPARSVQFHPEAGPGPDDAAIVLDEFLENVRGGLQCL
jgi:carbamoyl-phosphate synthase small subunit